MEDAKNLQGMPDVVILTGMSGAGRTEAMHVFEDLGYFCVDNLPAVLIGDLLKLKLLPGQTGQNKIAVVCDARNRAYFGSLMDEIEHLRNQNVDYCIVFLDANDEMLIARYKSSRRRHPMCEDGSSILAGIRRERELLFDLRETATYVIDTSNMLPQQLRATLRQLVSPGEVREGLAVSVYSFGFKYGAAADADVVMDVRFLPNPYYEAHLKHLTGLDTPVREFVLYRNETSEFLARWHALLDCIMPAFVAEGKQQLAIAIGCTGGQHRSVVLAEETADYLKACGYRVSIAHRDLSRANTAEAASADSPSPLPEQPTLFPVGAAKPAPRQAVAPEAASAAPASASAPAAAPANPPS